MDPEEMQHDPEAHPEEQPGPAAAHDADPLEHDADRAAAAEAIETARTGEGQSWRKTENPTGGEVWLKENSSTGLAKWSPEMDQPRAEVPDETYRPPVDVLDVDAADTERFLRAPEEVRKRIEEAEDIMAANAERAHAEWVRQQAGPASDPLRIHHPALSVGRMAVPQPLVNQHREACQQCGGTGHMPSINDYLRESVSLLGDQGDDVIRTFYRRLLTAAPELAKLFPGNPVEGDLGTDHRGAQQREKLLAAILALADLYDPDDGEKMERLDRALASFGRSHAAFARQDGTVRAATWEEYGAVKDALFATLIQVTGAAWKAEYTASWGQAYDYAAAMMIAEQYRSGFTSPRFPRA